MEANMTRDHKMAEACLAWLATQYHKIEPEDAFRAGAKWADSTKPLFMEAVKEIEKLQNALWSIKNEAYGPLDIEAKKFIDGLLK